MNTLEFLGLIVLVALTVIADAIRHQTPASQLRGVRALWLVYFCALLIVSGWFFVYLATNMTEVQPLQAVLPMWMVWLVYGFTGLYVLVALMRVGEVVHGLLRHRHTSTPE
ncbi:MAG TPA: hypothetical protein VFU60_12025 [Ktedonobacterales bacterium]|nr:hypothetical protein [Ktedonobacterales bacterium]